VNEKGLLSFAARKNLGKDAAALKPRNLSKPLGELNRSVRVALYWVLFANGANQVFGLSRSVLVGNVAENGLWDGRAVVANSNEWFFRGNGSAGSSQKARRQLPDAPGGHSAVRAGLGWGRVRAKDRHELSVRPGGGNRMRARMPMLHCGQRRTSEISA
jgi:hypothetical protein